jgi:hypothetical protein
MELKQASNHLTLAALQLELSGGVTVCVQGRSAWASGTSTSTPDPSAVAHVIRQAINGAYLLRQLEPPYPSEPSVVVTGDLRRVLLLLRDDRAAPGRLTALRFSSRDGQRVSRVRASSEAMVHREAYLRHLRSIYLHPYPHDLEAARREVDAKVLPILEMSGAFERDA